MAAWVKINYGESELRERVKATDAKWLPEFKVLRSPQRKHVPGMKNWITRCQPFDSAQARLSLKRTALLLCFDVTVCEASNFEKPGAVIPHAGIGEGAAG